MLKIIGGLFVARTKEFYRDRATLLWSIFFPICLVAAISLTLSDGDQKIFRVGIYGATEQASLEYKLLDEAYITKINYKNFDKALERIRHHQIDLLLSTEHPGYYWINKQSARGRATEQLLLATSQGSYVRQAVEGRDVRYIDWVIPGILSMNVMFGALFGIGFVIVRYRKNGVLKRLQVTPVTALQFLTAQVLSRLTVLMITITLVYAACNFFLDFMMLGSYLNLALVAFLGIFAMIAFALIIASRTASEELANGLLNFASFPMMLLSEVWFSMEDAPNWLVTVSNIFPLTHMVKAAREIMLNGADLASVAYHLWMLLAMCVIFLLIASMLFRWNEP